MTAIHYLQQTDPSQLRLARPAEIAVSRVFPADPALNARMYREIGADWNWTERIDWTDGQWSSYAGDPCITTLSARCGEDTVGYSELRMSPVGDGTDDVEVEIAAHGLLRQYSGSGVGGWFLSEVTRIAWRAPGCSRVWLHTRMSDSPNALPNYLARGFVEYLSTDDGLRAAN